MAVPYSDLFVLTVLFVLQVYVLKRPYVDEFLQRMGELFECVLFTASLAKVHQILNEIPKVQCLMFCVFCLIC